MKIKIIFDEKIKKSLAFDNNTKIGECSFLENQNIWNIVHTEVDEKYQGNGIARKLVELVIENAKKNNKKLLAECSYAKRILKDNNKKVLRDKYLLIRKNIQNKKEKSNLIFQKIIQDEDYINAKVIALYKNLKSEVSTEELIEYSLKNQKKVLLPKTYEVEIKFYKIKEKEKLIKSKFGVKEPLEKTCNLIGKKDIDLIIIPGICFDTEKNRLGFGKGYYDKYLENANIKTIAIAFEEQIIKNKILPVNKCDVKVNKIITDENIY